MSAESFYYSGFAVTLLSVVSKWGKKRLDWHDTFVFTGMLIFDAPHFGHIIKFTNNLPIIQQKLHMYRAIKRWEGEYTISIDYACFSRSFAQSLTLPLMRPMVWGMTGRTTARFSATPLGLPGRLMIRVCL